MAFDYTKCILLVYVILNTFYCNEMLRETQIFPDNNNIILLFHFNYLFINYSLFIDFLLLIFFFETRFNFKALV